MIRQYLLSSLSLYRSYLSEILFALIGREHALAISFFLPCHLQLKHLELKEALHDKKHPSCL